MRVSLGMLRKSSRKMIFIKSGHRSWRKFRRPGPNGPNGGKNMGIFLESKIRMRYLGVRI